MKVDRHVDAPRPQRSSHPHVIAQPIPATAVLDDQDVRQVRVAGDHRRGERFDEVEELGVREPAPDRANRRCREDHIANQARANEQNPQTGRVLRLPSGVARAVGLHRGFIDEHDRDVIPVSYTHLTLPTILLV